MQAVKINKTIINDGQIFLTGLPYRKGQTVEMILFRNDNINEKVYSKQKKYVTTKQLLNSKLVGLWQNRKDIKNSVEYANKLRNQSQNRR